MSAFLGFARVRAQGRFQVLAMLVAFIKTLGHHGVRVINVTSGELKSSGAETAGRRGGSLRSDATAC